MQDGQRVTITSYNQIHVVESGVTVHVIAADTLPVSVIIFLTSGEVLSGESLFLSLCLIGPSPDSLLPPL